MAGHPPARPSISVLMTVFNPDPRFFPIAVESILRQTFEDFELVIVEDPSPRSGTRMLDGLNDRRIRYMANAYRTGLIEQKNQGVAATRGALVAVLDADDVAEPDRLAKQVAFLRSHPEVDILGSQIKLIDSAGTIFGCRHFPVGHDAIVKALRAIVPISQPSVLLRREVLTGCGGYQRQEHIGGEDYELWSRLAKFGARFANHPEMLTRYRLHSAQMKVTCLRETIRGVLDTKRRYWIDQMDWSERLRMAGEFCLLGLPTPLVVRMLHWVHYGGRLAEGVANRDPGTLDAQLVTADGSRANGLPPSCLTHSSPM